MELIGTMPFPDKLRLLMRRHGLSQASLGAHVGVSHRAVGKWLAGDSAPQPDLAKRLADFLRVPVTDLFDDAKALPPDPVEEEMRTRYADAVAAANKLSADQPLAQQATFEKLIERGQHQVALKEVAQRLRQLADEIDPIPGLAAAVEKLAALKRQAAAPPLEDQPKGRRPA